MPKTKTAPKKCRVGERGYENSMGLPPKEVDECPGECGDHDSVNHMAAALLHSLAHMRERLARVNGLLDGSNGDEGQGPSPMCLLSVLETCRSLAESVHLELDRVDKSLGVS